jgi:ferritin-like metal-binding protein YciE
MNDLQKLMLGELRDIYDAEQQLVKALPAMARKANSTDLKQAFETHLAQTRNHIDRLKEAFHLLGEEPERKSCKGMEGLIDEGELIAAEYSENSALDAGLIGAAQKVEHYEISSYGTLATWAEELGAAEVAMLLKRNLAEEKETDAELTELAEAQANRLAECNDTHKRSEIASAALKFVTRGP